LGRTDTDINLPRLLQNTSCLPLGLHFNSATQFCSIKMNVTSWFWTVLCDNKNYKQKFQCFQKDVLASI